MTLIREAQQATRSLSLKRSTSIFAVPTSASDPTLGSPRKQQKSLGRESPLSPSKSAHQLSTHPSPRSRHAASPGPAPTKSGKTKTTTPRTADETSPLDSSEHALLKTKSGQTKTPLDPSRFRSGATSTSKDWHEEDDDSLAGGGELVGSSVSEVAAKDMFGTVWADRRGKGKGRAVDSDDDEAPPPPPKDGDLTPTGRSRTGSPVRDSIRHLEQKAAAAAAAAGLYKPSPTRSAKRAGIPIGSVRPMTRTARLQSPPGGR